MQKSNVITFRIDDDQMKAIDDIVARHRYYKRSTVMAQALRLMVAMEQANLGGSVLSYHPKFDDIVNIAFEIRRKVRD